MASPERKPGVISAALSVGWVARAMAEAGAGNFAAVGPCVRASAACMRVALAIKARGDSPWAQAAMLMEEDLREAFWEGVDG